MRKSRKKSFKLGKSHTTFLQDEKTFFLRDFFEVVLTVAVCSSRRSSISGGIRAIQRYEKNYSRIQQLATFWNQTIGFMTYPPEINHIFSALNTDTGPISPLDFPVLLK